MMGSDVAASCASVVAHDTQKRAWPHGTKLTPVYSVVEIMHHLMAIS